MTKAGKVTAESEAWDSGKLGHDEAFVRKAKPEASVELDNALDLQMISVRLQRQLIDDLKFIGTAHGIGYQPLMRDILSRFALAEKKKIMRDAVERRRLEEEAGSQQVVIEAKKKRAA